MAIPAPAATGGTAAASVISSAASTSTNPAASGNVAKTVPLAVVGAGARASPAMTTSAWLSTVSSTGSTSNECDSDGDGDGDDDAVLNAHLTAERLTGGFGPEDGPSFMSAAESETIVRIMQQYLPAVTSKREARE